jgi:polyhydroxyalkanoate synthesis repressor PhaR
MSEDTRLIKKYPNRRLYDTATSSYITLADVKKLVLGQTPFKVVDAKSSEDLTRSILLQIILEEESAGAPMFSSDMLSQIIRFYGNAMQGMMGTYLEKNIQTFMEIQRRWGRGTKLTVALFAMAIFLMTYLGFALTRNVGFIGLFFLLYGLYQGIFRSPASLD